MGPYFAVFLLAHGDLRHFGHVSKPVPAMSTRAPMLSFVAAHNGQLTDDGTSPHTADECKAKHEN